MSNRSKISVVIADHDTSTDTVIATVFFADAKLLTMSFCYMTYQQTVEIHDASLFLAALDLCASDNAQSFLADIAEQMSLESLRFFDPEIAVA